MQSEKKKKSVRKPRRASGRRRLDPDAGRNRSRRLQEAEGEEGQRAPEEEVQEGAGVGQHRVGRPAREAAPEGARHDHPLLNVILTQPYPTQPNPT